MLTPRERCCRAVKREEVDLIPINLWIDSPEPLKSLLNYFSFRDNEALLEHFKIDFRGFLPGISWLGIG
ncbi:MAG: hypothetical protein ACP5HX_11770, partial [Thermoproteota archaeon]